MSYKEDFDKAAKAGKTDRVTTQRRVLKPGDSIIGAYQGRDLIPSRKKGMKESWSYRFDTDDGPQSVFLSSAFDDRHGEGMVVGDLYSITYKEKINIAEGHTFKVFEVLHAPAVEVDGEEE